MIYVDTVTGKLVIDTETESDQASIIITRNAAGTHIQYKKATQIMQPCLMQRMINLAKNRSAWVMELQG